MGNKDKEKEHSDAGAMGTNADAAGNARQASWDLSHERAATLDKLVKEAIARETVQLTVMRTSLSTRDGNCGLRRLDMPLIAWRETQRRLKFHISTIV